MAVEDENKIVVIGKDDVEDPKSGLVPIQTVLYTLKAPFSFLYNLLSEGLLGLAIVIVIIAAIALLFIKHYNPGLADLLVLCGVAAAVIFSIRHGIEEAGQARYKRKLPLINKLQAAEDARRHKRSGIRSLERAIQSNAREAVDSLERMPHHLEAAQKQRELAGKRYRDEAYSPFWSAIEKTYLALNDYRMEAQSIHERAARHKKMVAEYVGLGGKDASLGDFPVELDAAKILKTLQHASDDVEKIVYEAQKHGTFATIWEQRRTTSTLVTGFANLEAAVENMGARISSAVRSMTEEAQLARHDTQKALADVSKTIERTSGQQSDTTRQAMKELNTHSRQIRDELYRQRWEGRSLLKG